SAAAAPAAVPAVEVPAPPAVPEATPEVPPLPAAPEATPEVPSPPAAPEATPEVPSPPAAPEATPEVPSPPAPEATPEVPSPPAAVVGDPRKTAAKPGGGTGSVGAAAGLLAALGVGGLNCALSGLERRTARDCAAGSAEAQRLLGIPLISAGSTNGDATGVAT